MSLKTQNYPNNNRELKNARAHTCTHAYTSSKLKKKKKKTLIGDLQTYLTILGAGDY